MMSEALCVGFLPVLTRYWFISSSTCCSLCMASRQFRRRFFFTVLQISASFASFFAASTIFRSSANRLSRLRSHPQTDLVVGEEVVQLEGGAHAPSDLRRPLARGQGVLLRQLPRQLLQITKDNK
ncbi:hypothetical protein CRUP_015337 [Coryphaenoides rupestris]|nr:hypothetical protein CRUP_015337 [Coryphaenoides rupestris]